MDSFEGTAIAPRTATALQNTAAQANITETGGAIGLGSNDDSLHQTFPTSTAKRHNRHTKASAKLL